MASELQLKEFKENISKLIKEKHSEYNQNQLDAFSDFALALSKHIVTYPSAYGHRHQYGESLGTIIDSAIKLSNLFTNDQTVEKKREKRKLSELNQHFKPVTLARESFYSCDGGETKHHTIHNPMRLKGVYTTDDFNENYKIKIIQIFEPCEVHFDNIQTGDSGMLKVNELNMDVSMDKYKPDCHLLCGNVIKITKIVTDDFIYE